MEGVIVGPTDKDKETRYYCHTRDCEDGWYEVTYTIDTIGRYDLHLQVNGTELTESPYRLTISGNRPDPESTVLKGVETKKTWVEAKPGKPAVEAKPARWEEVVEVVEEEEEEEVEVVVPPPPGSSEPPKIEKKIEKTVQKTTKTTKKWVEATPYIPEIPAQPAQWKFERKLPVGTAGALYTFEVEARDDFGDLRGFGGDSVVCKVSGGKPGDKTETVVEDRGDGTYEIRFTPESAGAYLVGVTLNGQHIAGSRFSLEVRPSAAHAPSCLASGMGLKETVAGNKARFSVQTWDAHGNVCTPPLSSFRVRLVCDGSPIVVVPRGIEMGNGRYTFSYSTEVAGEYDAHVLVATKVDSPQAAFSLGKQKVRYEPMHIRGSPFRVSIKPGPTYPPACGVGWVSKSILTVGRTAKLSIQSRDRFFNARDDWGDKFTLVLRAIMPKQTIDERSDSHNLVATDGRRQMDNPPPPLIRQGEVTEDPDVPGGYVAEVMAELAGEYKIILKYDAAESAVWEGVEEEPEEELTEEQKRLSEAAMEADLEEEAKQEEANRVANGVPPAPKLSFFTLATMMQKIQAWKKRGAAAAIANRKRSKRIYEAEVTYEADKTDPETCVVAGQGLWVSRPGERSKWSIQPRDRFSNVTNQPSSSFGVVVRPHKPGSNSEEELRAAKAKLYGGAVGGCEAEGLCSIAMNQGPYSATLISWLWYTHGEYDIHVLLGGVPLTGSPFRCSVAPTFGGERIQTMPQRQRTLDVYGSGAAVSWQEESAAFWENTALGDMHDYVQRGLAPALKGKKLALGSDVARTWAIEELDPGAYKEAQAEAVDGGQGGKRGRYAQRKRSAMLHFRLSAMSHELADGGVCFERPPEEEEPVQTKLPQPQGYAFGFDGRLMRSTAPDATPTPKPALSPRLTVGWTERADFGGKQSTKQLYEGMGQTVPPVDISSPRQEKQDVRERLAGDGKALAKFMAKAEGKEEPPSGGQLGWRRIRSQRIARRVVRDRVVAPPHTWRVLGPEPEPPAEPLPPALTPRAQALAMQLAKIQSVPWEADIYERSHGLSGTGSLSARPRVS